MQVGLIKKFIAKVYADERNVLIDHASLRSLSEDQMSIIEGFHLNELYMIELDDDYFCGICANHFCIE
jgi:hypothetical protein